MDNYSNFNSVNSAGEDSMMLAKRQRSHEEGKLYSVLFWLNVVGSPTILILSFIGGIIGTSFSTDLFIGQSVLRTAEANMSTRFMWALVICTMTMMTVPNIWALWRFRKIIYKTTQRNLHALVGKKVAEFRAEQIENKSK